MTPHDSPATRTRWAWLRTMLATAAVAALVTRGLVLHDRGALPIALVVLAAVLMLAIGAWRARRLSVDEHADSTGIVGPSGALLSTTAAIIVMVAAIGVASALR